MWPPPAHSPAFITKGLEMNAIHPARKEAHVALWSHKTGQMQNKVELPAISYPSVFGPLDSMWWLCSKTVFLLFYRGAQCGLSPPGENVNT